MKKPIIATISTILATATAVSLGVFIPAAQSMVSLNVAVIDSANFVRSPEKNKQLKVFYKDAILGTKAINNGNYVLYFGSQGIPSNTSFLYNIASSPNPEQFIYDKLVKKPDSQNEQIPLDGEMWKTIDYVMNSTQAKEKIIVPEFVGYIHSVYSIYAEGNKLFKELDALLAEVASVASNYKKWNSLSSQEQSNYQKKLNYLHERTDGYVVDTPLPNNCDDFSSLPPNLIPNEGWRFSPRNIKFSPNPYSTYTNINGETVYYLNDGVSQTFRSLVQFTQEMYPELLSISTSSGFIIGFRDGKLVANCVLSFPDSSINPDEGTGSTPPESTTKANPSIEPNKPTDSKFYNWIETEYAIDKNNSSENNNSNNG